MLSTLLICFSLFALSGASSTGGLFYPLHSNVSGVAYHRQDEAYSCAAAAFQTLLQHAGRFVLNQSEIVDVIRSSPSGGTLAPDVSRGSFFSNFSSAQGSVYPNKDLAGWKKYLDNAHGSEFVASPGLGLVSYSLQPSTCDINAIKKLISNGHPVLAMVYFYYNSTDVPGTDYYFGHFRVIYQYNEITQQLLAIDPWGRDNVPEVFKYSYGAFCGDLGWNYVQNTGPINIGPYWATVVSNWELEVLTLNTDLTTTYIGAVLTFPCPSPLCTEWDNFAAVRAFSNVTLTIHLPSGATISTDSPTNQAAFNAGTHSSNGPAVQVVWRISHPRASSSSVKRTITVVAQGTTTGSEPAFYGFPDLIYPAYSWSDNVGTQASAQF